MITQVTGPPGLSTITQVTGLAEGLSPCDHWPWRGTFIGLYRSTQSWLCKWCSLLKQVEFVLN